MADFQMEHVDRYGEPCEENDPRAAYAINPNDPEKDEIVARLKKEAGVTAGVHSNKPENEPKGVPVANETPKGKPVSDAKVITSGTAELAKDLTAKK